MRKIRISQRAFRITAKDPRKRDIMETFKRKYSCDRVTCVSEFLAEDGTQIYKAHCLARNSDGSFRSLGDQTLNHSDVFFNMLRNLADEAEKDSR